MHLPWASSLLFLASLPSTWAGKRDCPPNKGLDYYAKRAGLRYYGSATDSPGMRQLAGLEPYNPQYEEIMWKSGEFGQTTPLNSQKWSLTQPEQGVFNYTEADAVISKAVQAGMYVRCHPLVWHSQLPTWVSDGNWTADELRQVLVDHISNVTSHWKGKCQGWDVVNEALYDDGTYRNTVFYKVLGEEYIKLAFETAARADPQAKLYYNDYMDTPGRKSAAAKKVVKMLQQAGVKIDGVGVQMHLIAEHQPTLDQDIDLIRGFTELGVEVAVTEHDVRLSLPANEKNLAQQKEAYGNVAGACVQVQNCTGITIWDFYDPYSWVPAIFSGQGAACLWFGNFTHHPAYEAVVEALTNNTNCQGSGSADVSPGSQLPDSSGPEA